MNHSLSILFIENILPWLFKLINDNTRKIKQFGSIQSFKLRVVSVYKLFKIFYPDFKCGLKVQGIYGYHI